ncbi:MAG: hypothetical protein JRI23_19520 [Deltaproteobacteria bacterium]|jgi:hypothetical protein|nr:hypothetical protein [Deltaproteobacteria bacterium]MBW2534055.1 hypothetical protein [Deltaproteobacteria bacterium]
MMALASSRLDHGQRDLAQGTGGVAEPGEMHVGAALHGSYVDRICAQLADETAAALGMEERRQCLGFEGTEIVAEKLWVPPMPEAFLRVGLADDVDVGARLTLIGAELDLKVQPVDRSVFDLALGIRGRAFYSGGSILESGGTLPLLVTLRPTEWFAITATAQALASGWGEIFAASERYVAMLGVAAGGNLSFEVDDWFVRPEVTYSTYPAVVGGPPAVRELEIGFATFGIGVGGVIR